MTMTANDLLSRFETIESAIHSTKSDALNVQLVSAALAYAQAGFKVIPIAEDGKNPICKNGLDDATDNTDQIRAWWSAVPKANIGLVTGSTNGIGVVDIDVDNGKNGFVELESLDVVLPETVYQDTPRGGRHYIYSIEEPVANAIGWFGKGSAIDVRGERGYILAAPSIVRGKPYTLAVGEEVSAFPRMFSARANNQRKKSESLTEVVKSAPIKLNQSAVEQAIGFLEVCEAAVQGQFGHNALLSAANALMHGYALEAATAKKLLWQYYNPRCDPPWDPSNKSDHRDFERKVDEAVRFGSLQEKGYLLLEVIKQQEEGGAAIAAALLSANENALPAITLMPSEPEVEEKKVKPTSSRWKDLPTATPFKVDMVHVGVGEDPLSKLYKLRDSLPDRDELCTPPGNVGRLARYITETAGKAQPWLAVGASLSAHGAALGRLVRDIDNTRTNMYCVGIGISSAGKDHPLKAVQDVLEVAGCGSMLGGSDMTSDTAILQSLEDLPTHSGLIMLIDEMGLILKAVTKSQNNTQSSANIVPTLMKLYSSATSVYRGKVYAQKKMHVITEPHLCVWGATTPETFFAAVKSDNIRDGFMGRIMPFQTKTFPRYISGRGKPPPSEVVAWFSDCYSRTQEATENYVTVGDRQVSVPNITMIEETDGAKKAREEFALLCEKLVLQAHTDTNRNSEAMSLWGKAHENCRKIALTLAGADRMVINKQLMDMAIAYTIIILTDYVESICGKMADTSEQECANAILELLMEGYHIKDGEDAGKTIKGFMPKRDITRRTQKWDNRVRQEAINRLMDGEMVLHAPQAMDKYGKNGLMLADLAKKALEST